MNDADWLWNVPPTNLTLMPGEVHVWRALLEVPTSQIVRLQNVLVSEEIARARRFYFEKDRRYWTVARAVLRMLLGRYLDIDPRELCFVTNDYGKPAIVSPLSGTRLYFNLSHSGDLALYAFVYDRQVGVDVESMREDIDYRQLATHHFSARECAALEELPESLQKEAFFLCWSRKEAYIKARGKGLSLPLDQFDVSLIPGEPAALLDSREEPGATGRWSLYALEPGDRYAGALVVEGSSLRLCRWQWQD